MDGLREAVWNGVRCWRHLRFTRGDLDAVTQLFLNNVGTTLVVAGALLTGYDPRNNSTYSNWYESVLGKNPSFVSAVSSHNSQLVFVNTVVGLAISLFVGSVYYSWLALRVGEGRGMTALPFGVNTPAAFAFLAGILLPQARLGFDACYVQFGGPAAPSDLSGLQSCVLAASDASWRAGVLSNFVCGLLCVALSLVGNLIERYTPRVSLLSSLATIGIAFLVLAQLSLNFADPLAGLLPVLLMVLGYFCGVTFWVLPTSVTIVLVGTALSWATGQVSPEQLTATFSEVRWQGATTAFSVLGDWSLVPPFLGVTIPFAVQSAVGTLMNVYSAQKAGDKFPLRESMIVDGLASCVGACFGTPLMSSVYIGHPGFKKMGATAGYTAANSAAFLLFALFGLFSFINGLIPPSALAPVIAFIGLIITCEAMDGLRPRHFPVFVIGLLPSICSWASQNGLAAFGAANWGYIAMGGNSAMLLSMVFTAILAFASDRHFTMAAAWSLVAAVCAAFGLLHQDTVSVSNFATPHGAYCINLLGPDGEVAPNAPVAYSNLTSPGSCAKGFVPCNGGQGCGWEATVAWRFTVAYVIFAAVFGILYLLQRFSGNNKLAQIIDQPTDQASEDASLTGAAHDSSDDKEAFPGAKDLFKDAPANPASISAV